MDDVFAQAPAETRQTSVPEISRGLLGLTAYALRIYLLSALILALGVSLFAGGYAWFIATDETRFRGLTAGLLASGATGTLGLFFAFKITLFYTIARAVKQSALGARILTLLLKSDRAAGLADKLDYSETELRQELLVQGARIHQRISLAQFPRLMRRLVRNGTRLLIRLVSEKILAAAAMDHAEGRRITTESLVHKLAERIDRLIIDELRGSALRFAIGAALLALLLVGLCAHGMRFVPGF